MWTFRFNELPKRWEPAFATERHQKDIVHRGDTVNTAARVEAQRCPLERRVLVSEALVSQCQVPEELEEMRERELRGKVEALRLYCARSRI
jgi:class 3 adenylate cyclase